MADVKLTNQANVQGEYGDPATAITFSSNIVTTTIVQGLTVTKNADKTNWTEGPLTYTIVVKNDSGSTLTNGMLIDNLDTSLVEFSSSYGVKIDGVTSTEFTITGGELKITLPSLDTGGEKTITFQVTKKV